MASLNFRLRCMSPSPNMVFTCVLVMNLVFDGRPAKPRGFPKDDQKLLEVLQAKTSAATAVPLSRPSSTPVNNRPNLVQRKKIATPQEQVETRRKAALEEQKKKTASASSSPNASGKLPCACKFPKFFLYVGCFSQGHLYRQQPLPVQRRASTKVLNAWRTSRKPTEPAKHFRASPSSLPVRSVRPFDNKFSNDSSNTSSRSPATLLRLLNARSSWKPTSPRYHSTFKRTGTK